MKRKVVLGLGNILNRDEGAGVYALRELEKRLPENLRNKFELIDGGVLGMNLLPIIEETSHLLILDALDSSLEPGELKEIRGPELSLFYSGKISWHQLGIQEVLAMARIRNKFPDELCLIGIQPKDLGSGTGLSPTIKRAIKFMAKRALSVIKEWETVGQNKSRETLE
jgi:hydrogenase maturation protease